MQHDPTSTPATIALADALREQGLDATTWRQVVEVPIDATARDTYRFVHITDNLDEPTNIVPAGADPGFRLRFVDGTKTAVEDMDVLPGFTFYPDEFPGVPGDRTAQLASAVRMMLDVVWAVTG